MCARPNSLPRQLVLGVLVLMLVVPFDAEGQSASTVVVREAAEEVLASRFPESAEQLEVRVRRVRGSVDRADNIRLDFSEHIRRPTGLTQVQVQRKTPSGRWTESGWAVLNVARYDSVMTVRDRILEGEAITPDRVETAWIEVTGLRGEPLRASDYKTRRADGSLVATHLLQAGDVVRKREVRRPHATNIGTSVKMRYTSDRFVFRLSCKAREPGSMEDVIRVYCPDTESTYRARVTGEETARWIETL